MVSFLTFCVTLVALMPDLNLAFFGSSPQRAVSEPVQRKRSFELPIQRRRTTLPRRSPKRGTDSGTTGLGDFFDQIYGVPITIGKIVTAVTIDTGSSDLWVVSDACETTVCRNSNMPAYPSANITLAGGAVNLQYGDSTSGTYANGPVAQDVAAIAGLSMSQQIFAAISDTNSTAVTAGTNGIIGLGFPSTRYVLGVFFCRPGIQVQLQPSAKGRHRRKVQ